MHQAGLRREAVAGLLIEIGNDIGFSTIIERGSEIIFEENW